MKVEYYCSHCKSVITDPKVLRQSSICSKCNYEVQRITAENRPTVRGNDASQTKC